MAPGGNIRRKICVQFVDLTGELLKTKTPDGEKSRVEKSGREHGVPRGTGYIPGPLGCPGGCLGHPGCPQGTMGGSKSMERS